MTRAQIPQMGVIECKKLDFQVCFKEAPRFAKGFSELPELLQQAQQNITISQVVAVFLRFLELTVLTDLNMRTFW